MRFVELWLFIYMISRSTVAEYPWFLFSEPSIVSEMSTRSGKEDLLLIQVGNTQNVHCSKSKRSERICCWSLVDVDARRQKK